MEVVEFKFKKGIYSWREEGCGSFSFMKKIWQKNGLIGLVICNKKFLIWLINLLAKPTP